MTAIYPVTFVMSAVLIYKWTLSHYDDDDSWNMQQALVTLLDNIGS